MDPVPLDKGTQPAADLYNVLNGVIVITAGRLTKYWASTPR